MTTLLEIGQDAGLTRAEVRHMFGLRPTCPTCGGLTPFSRGRYRKWCSDLCHDRFRALVRSALNRGDLVRAERCERCGSDKQIEGHHADYEKPLEVEWICRDCHLLHHYSTQTEEEAAAVTTRSAS